MFINYLVRCNWKLCSVSLRIAGISLEPFCYNVGCKTERECLKSKRIGRSAAKFPDIDNTKFMCYNIFVTDNVIYF